MSGKKTEIRWSTTDELFESFTRELCDYTRNGQTPKTGDQDVQAYMSLQKQRLMEKNITMEYDIEPREEPTGVGDHTKRWSDKRYVNKMEWHPCRLIKTFYQNGKRIHKKKSLKIFYQISTDTQQNAAVGEDTYICPNCGGVSMIKELQEGCSFCGTRFKMDDLFPKVSNYFFVEDMPFGNEVKKFMVQVIVPSIVVSIIYMFNLAYKDDSIGPIQTILTGILGGALLGVIAGYTLVSISLFIRIFSQLGDSVKMLSGSVGSRNRFVQMMQQYSPEFSYEYFVSKVNSLVRMILYSKDATELPNYCGGPLGERFSNIVDSTYAGAVGLKNFQVTGEYVNIVADTYIENFYLKNGRIKRKLDRFRLHLCKNITKPIDFSFSIKKIQCPSCACSFDATMHKTCPNCGSGYRMENYDWIITKIERK